MADPVITAYADSIDESCPRCGALPGRWCVNPVSRQESATPCLVRGRAVDHIGNTA